MPYSDRFPPLLLLTLFLIPLTLFSLAVPVPSRAQIELGASGNVGVRTAPTTSVGLLLEKDADDTSSNYVKGLRGYVTGGNKSTFGVQGKAVGASYRTHGVYGLSDGGSSASFGLRGRAKNNGGDAYGVYAYAEGNSEVYAGYFAGDVTVTGTFNNPSDSKFKRDIQALGDSTVLTKLLQLQPKSFRFKRDEYEDMGFPAGRRFGLIAQEVQDVLPELVNTEVQPGATELNDEGEIISFGEPISYKSVEYLDLIPLLVQMVKEQQAEIETLRDELSGLKNALESQGIDVE